MIELDKDAMPQKTNLDVLRERSAEEIVNKASYFHENFDFESFEVEFLAWLNSPVEVKE